MNKILLFLFFFFILPSINSKASTSQNKIDSLLSVQKKADDTTLVKVYNSLCEEYKKSDLEKAKQFGLKGKELSERINFRKGMADSYNKLGVVYWNESDYPSALDYFKKSLIIYEELKHNLGIASASNNIGIIYYINGDYPKTLNYFLRSLKVREALDNKVGMAESYNNIGAIYENLNNYKQALEYHFKSLKIREELKDKSGVASSYSNIGILYNNEGKSELALNYHLKSLKIRTELNDKSGMANSYSNIGIIYHDTKNYPLSLDYHFKSLKIKEELKDKKGMAISYTNIGSVYEMQKKYDLAINFQNKALELAKEIGALETIKFSTQSLADAYKANGNYKKALEYYEKYTLIKDSILGKEKLDEMADLKAGFEIDKKEGELALISKTKDAVQKIELDKQKTISRTVIFGSSLVLLLAVMTYRGYRQKKKTNILLEDQKEKVELANKKISTLNHGLKIIHEIDRSILAALSLEEIANASLKYLLELYPHVERASFITFELNRNKAKMLAVSAKKNHSLDTGQDFDADSLTAYPLLIKGEIKKVDDIRLLTNPSSSDNELIKQGLYSYIMMPLMYEGELIGSLNLSANTPDCFNNEDSETLSEIGNELALAIQQFRFKEIIKNKNFLLEDKNKEILDSITYAKRLQDAILPPIKLVNKYLKDSFILYKPKDIVAGDFYWMEIQDDIVFLAAADCTGHGVPGAMVSVVCSNALNRTLNEFAIKEPGKILDKVRELVIETFEKSESEVMDGMDISLCSLNIQARELKWAGANNPLWLIRQSKLLEITANKQPIGKTDNPKDFTTHTLQLEKGDLFFLFTDGFADQFGGPKGKKFKYKQLEEILIANVNLSLIELSSILDQTFNDWKSALEQVDDVLIIGVKV